MASRLVVCRRDWPHDCLVSAVGVVVYRRGGWDSLLIVLELGLELTCVNNQRNSEVPCGDIIHVMCMFTVLWYTSGLGVINILPEQHRFRLIFLVFIS